MKFQDTINIKAPFGAVLERQCSAVPVKCVDVMFYLQVLGATVQVHFLLVVFKVSAEWEAPPSV